MLAAAYYVKLRADNQDVIIDAVTDQLIMLSGGEGVRPFTVEAFSGLLAGYGVMAPVALLAIGVEPTKELLKSREPKDLIQAAVWHLETGMDLEKILS